VDSRLPKLSIDAGAQTGWRAVQHTLPAAPSNIEIQTERIHFLARPSVVV